VVDDGAPQAMTKVPGSKYLVHLQAIEPGRTHSFSVIFNGRPVAMDDVAGYLGQSYDAEGVARGSMTEPRQVPSRIYPGAVTTYWLYVSAGADSRRGAPVMIWHDGAGYVGPRDLTGHRLQIVSDNLVAQGLIPPMVHVLVSPSMPGEPLPVRYEGQTPEVAMRGLQYDTVSERYGRHLLDEVLPDAGRVCKLRADGYSRGSAGLSSGGTCAFTLSWLHTGEFSRAHCGIGSFTALLWDPDAGLDRGHLLPYFVRRQGRRNIRVWISDGANDIEVDRHGRPEIFSAGSWPLANLEMANALKLAGYDFHFRFGTAGHNHAQTALDLPESLAWLWRDYDPDGSGQEFEQEQSEQSEPVYRVGTLNRRAW
jgi:enterochelin esterase family protein